MDDDCVMVLIQRFRCELGNVLQKERLKKKMTIDDVAFESNISSNHMKNILAGTANPSITILLKLSSGLEMPLSEVIKNVETNMKGG